MSVTRKKPSKHYGGCTLHQIAPYLGKTRPKLARELIASFSKEGDWIWDPFCGSGTIPLEAKLQNRNVFATDINPYACHITRSKLHAPSSPDWPIGRLDDLSKQLTKVRPKYSVDAPAWVKAFFHPNTLHQIRFLAKSFLRQRDYFLMGCLLGILHHQRPGFLSHPASHLIPYLRSKAFPRTKYPEAYAYRDPIPRLISKVQRVLKVPCVKNRSGFRVFQRSIFHEFLDKGTIDTVITSPPYMNNLDYARDNRLRLWFLGVDDHEVVKKLEIGGQKDFRSDMLHSLKIISHVLKSKGKCVLILGDVTSNSRSYDLPSIISKVAKEHLRELQLVDSWSETIPYERRSLRYSQGTKRETALIFKKK